MAKRPTDSTRSSRTQTARQPITLELATSVCPNEQIAANIARHFALEPVDYHAVREAHEEAVGNMAKAFDTTLNDKATAMHFQRVVGSLVGSAFGAGGFYGQKVSEARDLTAKSANEDRDEDRDGVYGFDSKAQRAREFAAKMGLQAFAQLAAAEGAVHAYAAITGEEWKPYVAPADNTQSVNRQSATAELGAFGE
jgi:ribosomal protein L17